MEKKFFGYSISFTQFEPLSFSNIQRWKQQTAKHRNRTWTFRFRLCALTLYDKTGYRKHNKTKRNNK